MAKKTKVMCSVQRKSVLRSFVPALVTYNPNAARAVLNKGEHIKLHLVTPLSFLVTLSLLSNFYNFVRQSACSVFIITTGLW